MVEQSNVIGSRQSFHWTWKVGFWRGASNDGHVLVAVPGRKNIVGRTIQ